MDSFIDDLANVISTYLNEHGLYTYTYKSLPGTFSTKLLDIYKYDPSSMIEHCKNTVLGKCTLYLKSDNLILYIELYEVTYSKSPVKFLLHDDESLQQILNTAQQAFDNGLKEIEEYRTKEYGHDDS